MGDDYGPQSRFPGYRPDDRQRRLSRARGHAIGASYIELERLGCDGKSALGVLLRWHCQ